MEIRNTATQRELEWLDTPELILQLMIRLRNIAVHENPFAPPSEAPSERMMKSIELAQRIQAILSRRTG